MPQSGGAGDSRAHLSPICCNWHNHSAQPHLLLHRAQLHLLLHGAQLHLLLHGSLSAQSWTIPSTGVQLKKAQLQPDLLKDSKASPNGGWIAALEAGDLARARACLKQRFTI